MIKKQNIWFTFLCSIILLLSIVYVSMNQDNLKDFNIEEFDDVDMVLNESTELVALRIQDDEEELETINELQSIILDSSKSASDKSNAYDSLIDLTTNKSLETKLETMIKESFKFDSYVKINGDNITIFVKSDKHDYSLANEIIRKIDSIVSNKYITVKFN